MVGKFGMSESFDYASRANGRRMVQLVRDRRKLALKLVSQICVSVSKDGTNTQDVMFDETPTLAELVKKAGDDVKIVSIEQRRRPTTRELTRPLLLVN